jgi:hypothetical protein
MQKLPGSVDLVCGNSRVGNRDIPDGGEIYVIRNSPKAIILMQKDTYT